MSTAAQRLEASSFDVEYEAPDGLIHGGLGVTLTEAIAAVSDAKVDAFETSAKFIRADADKWRPVDPGVADAMDRLAVDLTQHARRIRRNG